MNHHDDAMYDLDAALFPVCQYKKNGQPVEVFLGHLIQNKFIRPKVRLYQTNNHPNLPSYGWYVFYI